MKKEIDGVVQNSSTNPFQTFARKTRRNSALLSFDISFDLADEDGNTTHVWFNRSFRMPPPLEDGDYIRVVGRRGQFMGLIGRKNFYALKIIDQNRGKEYTPWRNKELIAEAGKNTTGEQRVQSV